MRQKPKNYAFIDGQNLYLAIQRLGWKLDYQKFREYLAIQYSVDTAYYFIGYVQGNNDLYASLQAKGFILIFKPTIPDPDGTIKGNCDADLVLWTMIEYEKYNQAVIVSGDGDFYSLVKYLREQEKLRNVLAPDFNKYSGLLKTSAGSHLAFMNSLRHLLEFKQKQNVQIKKAPPKKS